MTPRRQSPFWKVLWLKPASMRSRLQKAVENEDVDEMAAVSHKMIPLFTLIGATELVALLKLLETSHGVPFTGELKEHALAALVLIEDVITQATAFP